ncbi:MAG TPA: SRPBCC family protein [Terriglobales bacterium]
MKLHTFHSEIWVPHSRDDVFQFFSRAENLEVLTPNWLHCSILSTPAAMTAGARIKYRLRLRGIPIRWESEITAWEPPQRFIDEQRIGPYRQWVHEHQFLEHDGGTRILDHVQYAVPADWLVHRLLVAPDLRRIFAFRRQKISEIFGSNREAAR